MAVRAMAISNGKKRAKTGIRMVPSPKPEKKVSMAAPEATAMMRTYSMLSDDQLLGDHFPAFY